MNKMFEQSEMDPQSPEAMVSQTLNQLRSILQRRMVKNVNKMKLTSPISNLTKRLIHIVRILPPNLFEKKSTIN